MDVQQLLARLNALLDNGVGLEELMEMSMTVDPDIGSRLADITTDDQRKEGKTEFTVLQLINFIVYDIGFRLIPTYDGNRITAFTAERL